MEPWKHEIKHAVPWRFEFDPYPHYTNYMPPDIGTIPELRLEGLRRCF